MIRVVSGAERTQRELTGWPISSKSYRFGMEPHRVALARALNTVWHEPTVLSPLGLSLEHSAIRHWSYRTGATLTQALADYTTVRLSRLFAWRLRYPKATAGPEHPASAFA